MVELLIIGKNGQLGNALIKVASSRKLKFEAFSRKELDVTNTRSMSAIIQRVRPKVILNTSAYHVLPECEKNPHLAFSVNSIAVVNLAKIAKSINANLVTFSTNYVFDGEKKTPYLESDIPNPLQIFGLSKFAGEIASLNEYKEGTYIIRTCGLYGKGRLGSKIRSGNFVLKILNEAKENGVVTASKKLVVSPTYASDLAVSTLDLLNSKAGPGIYHLTNEGSCTWYEFAKSILFLNKNKAKLFPLVEEKKDFRRPVYTALANVKAKKYGIVLPKIVTGLDNYIQEI